MTISNFIVEEVEEVARKLLLNFKHIKIWCFYAEMGVGKTTLIKEICNQLQAVDKLCSPTFAIINEYETLSREPIYHIDCYRLKSLKEAADIGLDEYLHSSKYCFIEWPQVVESMLLDEHVKIQMNFISETERALSVSIL